MPYARKNNSRRALRGPSVSVGDRCRSSLRNLAPLLETSHTGLLHVVQPEASARQPTNAACAETSCSSSMERGQLVDIASPTLLLDERSSSPCEACLRHLFGGHPNAWCCNGITCCSSKAEEARLVPLVPMFTDRSAPDIKISSSRRIHRVLELPFLHVYCKKICSRDRYGRYEYPPMPPPPAFRSSGRRPPPNNEMGVSHLRRDTTSYILSLVLHTKLKMQPPPLSEVCTVTFLSNFVSTHHRPNIPSSDESNHSSKWSSRLVSRLAQMIPL